MKIVNDMHMTWDQFGHFLIVLGMLEVAVLMMFRTMREPKVTVMKVIVILSCLFLVFWAFYVGDVWSPHDFTCHPHQHCFPWGD
jgi:hypothetical protein